MVALWREGLGRRRRGCVVEVEGWGSGTRERLWLATTVLTSSHLSSSSSVNRLCGDDFCTYNLCGDRLHWGLRASGQHVGSYMYLETRGITAIYATAQVRRTSEIIFIAV
ncbi:uncharacterized protein LOC133782410 isoform X2 [Humulus lupulus]|uniref:uncharacterized protein LOC133782410 isoform X2 n=1 Tax=Humulus lupulus TaxID=3486 RepID=UPI002B413BD4|nr:uncharacterized protein LOC133782410 isoform X2 [Humulus lupulus]